MAKTSKIIGLAGATGAVAAVAAVYLSKKRNREILLNKASELLNPSRVKELGRPSDVDDANMVSEGAMTSIRYYNVLQETANE